MKIVKITTYFLFMLLLSGSTYSSYAQLKKTAKIEKVRSFTNGSVILNKIVVDEREIYAVTLPNNSKYHEPVIFYLGEKEEMIKNLVNLSKALEDGEKGDFFEFSACGIDYQLSFSQTLGQKCFKIWEPINTTNDFGRFFKKTIDDILKFYTESKEPR